MQYFQNELNWTDAQSFCQEDGGELAPVRSQSEQDFLLFLRTRADVPEGLFWVSGNSFGSPTFVWGDPYGESVDFTEIWGKSIVKTIPRGAAFSNSMMPDMAILNGHRAAYSWNIVSGAGKQDFICRKESCAGDKDIDIERGICWTVEHVEEVAASVAWIAGAIAGGIILIVILVFVCGWYKQAGWYNTLVKGYRNDQIHVRQSLMGSKSGFGLHNPRASAAFNEPRASAIAQLPTLISAGGGEQRPASSGPAKRLSNQVGGTVPVPLPNMAAGSMVPTVRPAAPADREGYSASSRKREARPKSTPKSIAFMEAHTQPPPPIEVIAGTANNGQGAGGRDRRPSFQLPSQSMGESSGLGLAPVGFAGVHRASLENNNIAIEDVKSDA